jgi:hypothetical protein
MQHNNSPLGKVAPGLGLIITPWRGQLSFVVWLRCPHPPRVDFLLRSVYSYKNFIADYSIKNLCPLSKSPRAITGTGRLPGNIIAKQNLIVFCKKNYPAVFHERPARGPLRNSRGLWGQEFHGPCPDDLKVTRAHSPDRHRLPVG